MRKAEEIVAHLPKGQMITTRQKVERLVEQAQRETIEEAAKLAKHNQDGSGGEWDSASLAIEEAIRALLPHEE